GHCLCCPQLSLSVGFPGNDVVSHYSWRGNGSALERSIGISAARSRVRHTAGASMTINFRCPECQQLFRAQEAYAGRQWNCPKCSTSFPIPQPEEMQVEMVMERHAPPPRRRERPDDYDREERRYRDDRDLRLGGDIEPGWWTTRGGLRVLGVGLTI